MKSISASSAVWAEAARALAAFSDGVVTAVDPNGYPVSIRQSLQRYDATTGEMLIAWPDTIAVVEGPANLLCHSHDEKLWNLRGLQIKGRLERRGEDWAFVGHYFTPPAGMLAMFWRAARTSRRAGDRYLKKRGLQRPQVNWTAIKEMQRRAGSG